MSRFDATAFRTDLVSTGALTSIMATHLIMCGFLQAKKVKYILII